jgi:hypothetical protein
LFFSKHDGDKMRGAIVKAGLSDFVDIVQHRGGLVWFGLVVGRVNVRCRRCSL